MTLDDILLLDSSEVREAVAQHVDDDPARVALDRRLPHAGLVATQVKYLQRAASKLPSYSAAGCIIPPLAFEQSSSEECAAHKRYGGGLCIDLTCGLGVDSFMLARGFRRVVSVERSEVLAEAARINFRRLGVDNVEVVCASAEEYLAGLGPDSADMIYVDPDRRSASGSKMVRLEDCSPDVTALREKMLSAAPLAVVKNSPLFDVDEAFRIFGGSCGLRVEAVSLGGECKEVMIEMKRERHEPRIAAWVVGKGGVEYPLGGEEIAAADGSLAEGIGSGAFDRAVLPDVTLRKARIGRRYVCERFRGACPASENGFVFIPAGVADSGCGPLLGRVFEIVRADRYKPRQLKRSLRERGVKCATVMRHDFPVSSAEAVRALGLREGAGPLLALTAAGGVPWVLELRPANGTVG